MKSFIHPVSSQYGSPMGRYTGPDYLDTSAGPLYLRQVNIDTQGYDNGGAYWGLGIPLWETIDQDGNGKIFRATCRQQAKQIIRQDYPDATFYK
jgi:hypothetical protein